MTRCFALRLSADKLKLPPVKGGSCKDKAASNIAIHPTITPSIIYEMQYAPPRECQC